MSLMRRTLASVAPCGHVGAERLPSRQAENRIARSAVPVVSTTLKHSTRGSNPMSAFPPLTHVALTVRDLSVSVPWYEALLDAAPVIDEDTDPDLPHTVYLIGNGTL